jgi:hypothetical protein
MAIPLIMRDDIHKSAPTTAKWRRWVKSCARDAERGALAIQHAVRAIASDCNKELDPRVLSALVDRSQSPERDMFSSIVDGCPTATKSVMQQQLLDHTRMAERKGMTGPDAVKWALAATIEARKESQARAVRAHVLKSGDRDARECVKAINESLSAVSSADLAQRLIDNGGRIPLERPRRGVDLDEPL